MTGLGAVWGIAYHNLEMYYDDAQLSDHRAQKD